ncbi:putative short transmembrane mitochondrial protein [Helianthus annuus]|uniref:Short transmembrane mitochondrial protein n=1 Tax=Helianthus annuus TaxID=4232 RepID=A0A9K3JPT2_HELAN|nr:putative short transmembrane mitochondrial protein [Helianthus annuus]KAJ0605286.1 putative short transmembrane mitochondrial protein [Helianthus annuus]KAJ0616052.1 putative short transmembrane mitochondrial protein [Helianthus annuus]KAJ0619302.1 putative short transmembrane mitochondrial protein [Helianthus annuus]KAJ0777761.1 putative short transmembrane mitochondrial protein [Helianthus annuus]
MGLILRNFSFMAGTLLGIYVAQNYDVPDVKTLANQALTTAKQLEERYRKRN